MSRSSLDSDLETSVRFVAILGLEEKTEGDYHGFLWRGTVEIKMSIWGVNGSEVWLEWIHADKKGCGRGTRALKRIVKLADKLGITLYLTVGPPANGDGYYRGNPAGLARFYRKFGFRSYSGKHMNRKPNKIK